MNVKSNVQITNLPNGCKEIQDKMQRKEGKCGGVGKGNGEKCPEPTESKWKVNGKGNVKCAWKGIK